MNNIVMNKKTTPSPKKLYKKGEVKTVTDMNKMDTSIEKNKNLGGFLAAKKMAK
jgi:hypothetical protein